MSASAAGTATSGTVVSAALDEWSLALSRATTRAGKVTFVVKNKGTMVHELVVLRSETHHHLLKVNGGKAVEKGRLARIPAIPTGVSKRITLKLLPGKYLLLCNLLGHYQAGQRAALRVR